MAEAFANHLARERDIDLVAESAGTAAGKELNPIARQAMEEAGISMEGQTPKLLTQEMANAADRIITMGCGVDAEACPARFMVSEDWGLDDPAGQPTAVVARIRDEVRQKVEALLEEVVGDA